MKIPVHEELLLARCSKRESEAVETLIRLYGQRIYGFVKTLLGQKAEQTHNLMIRVFAEAIDEVIPFSMHEPFLVTLMKKLIPELEKEMKSNSESLSWRDLDSQRQTVFQALQPLVWQHKILLLMRDQLDFTYDEIAAVTHASPHHVRSELQSARMWFRESVNRLLQGGKG